jgi:DNA-binding transcriptional MerR regulator
VTTGKSDPGAAGGRRGVYGISVAADLVGTGVQNLRLYERRGLLRPGRSSGGTRLYSAEDVLRLRRIIDLLAAGVNLAGIAMVLDLQDDNTRMRRQLHRQSTGQHVHRLADASRGGVDPLEDPGGGRAPPPGSPAGSSLVPRRRGEVPSEDLWAGTGSSA